MGIATTGDCGGSSTCPMHTGTGIATIAKLPGATTAPPCAQRPHPTDRRDNTVADLVPPDWQLQPPDPNLKGQRFVSADGTASLALFATPAKRSRLRST